jgi:hypothetical protein
VGATLAYPTLPAAIAEFNILDTDSATIFDLWTAKVPGGYDAVRANVLSVNGPAALVFGASGRIVAQRWMGAVGRTAPRTTHWLRAPTRSR